MDSFAALRAVPLARSIAHYLILRGTWGVVDVAPPPLQPATASGVASSASTPPAAAAAPAAPPAAAASPCAPLSPPGLRVRAPAWLPCREMLATSCGFLAPALAGHLGEDVEMFLEQCVIAVRAALRVLGGGLGAPGGGCGDVPGTVRHSGACRGGGGAWA